MGLIDRATLGSVLAQKLGIPQVDLKRYAFDANWADLAPYAVCREHAVVPLQRRGESIVMAMENPLDVAKLNALAFSLGQRVVPVLALADDIESALDRHPERRLHETLQHSPEETGAEEASALAAQLASEEAPADALAE